MSQSIEVIVRGLVLRESYVLVVRRIGANYAFLPGGHVELGEPARAALEREFAEELGVCPSIGAFLGAIEHGWLDDGQWNQEISLLFRVDAHEDLGEGPSSLESHLSFFWCGVDRLAEVNFQPHCLRGPLRELANGKPFPAWLSTIDPDGSEIATDR